MTHLTDAFRLAMRRHVAGVCVLSVGRGEDVNAMVVTAATSFSLTPPSVLVCVNAAASLSPRLQDGTPFALTLLDEAQRDVAAAVSGRSAGLPRFGIGGWSLRPDAPPRLEGALVELRCRVVREAAYGTHRALIGAVEEVTLGPERGSLVYRDGDYG